MTRKQQRGDAGRGRKIQPIFTLSHRLSPTLRFVDGRDRIAAAESIGADSNARAKAGQPAGVLAFDGDFC